MNLKTNDCHEQISRGVYKFIMIVDVVNSAGVVRLLLLPVKASKLIHGFNIQIKKKLYFRLSIKLSCFQYILFKLQLLLAAFAAWTIENHILCCFISFVSYFKNFYNVAALVYSNFCNCIVAFEAALKHQILMCLAAF